MTKIYDLAVIGTGTAAVVAATRVRAAGWTVAVVDFRPFGGTCALRGCAPKKMMIGGADAADHAWRMKSRGVALNKPLRRTASNAMEYADASASMSRASAISPLD